MRALQFITDHMIFKLRYNQIYQMKTTNECVTNISDCDRHLLTKDNLIAGQPEFLLSGNPLICDCDLEWLPGINSEEMQEHHPRVSDLSDIKCRLNNQR